MFECLRHKAESPEFRGCAFGLGVAEHGESARIVSLASLHKSAVAEVLYSITRRAGFPEPDQIARHLLLHYHGALARRAVYGTATPMREAKYFSLALLDHVKKGKAP